MTTQTQTNTPTLHWWVAGAVLVACVAPLLGLWAIALQLVALSFAVYALFKVHGAVARTVVITAIVVVSFTIAIQVVGAVAAYALQGNFEDTGAPLG